MTDVLEMLSETLIQHAPEHPACLDALTVLNRVQRGGTARDWFRAHEGQNVTTIQQTRSGVWAPSGRQIITHGSFVVLGDSRRYYAGLTVVSRTDRVLIVRDEDHAAIAYVIEPTSTDDDVCPDCGGSPVGVGCVPYDDPSDPTGASMLTDDNDDTEQDI
jgi:hypothetical protein